MKVALSEPACVCLSNVFIPFNKHLTCFTTFCLCWDPFLQSRQDRAWSVATGLCGLVVRIQGLSGEDSVAWLQSLVRELRSCFKPPKILQATRDQCEVSRVGKSMNTDSGLVVA